MRYAKFASLLLLALTLNACTSARPPELDAAARPESLITVSSPGSLTDAELGAQYGGSVVLRTAEFALIGLSSKPGTLTAQGKGRSQPNRRVMRVGELKANGLVGLWGSGIVGLWGSGIVGLWGSGVVGLWASGSYANLPQNTANWQRIGLESAQRRLTGLGTGVTVAVIDTGVDVTHPAFTGRLSPSNLWRDFVDGDGLPQDAGTLGQGLTGHGSEVAGIVLQIAPNATILPLRVLNAAGEGDVADLARAIVYAADQGVDVINLSLGADSPVEAISQAIAYANARGVVVSASAGNAGQEGLDYPAQEFEQSSMNVAVGSVSALDQLSSFSQYGTSLGLLAPGEEVYGPAPQGQMMAWSGTSMSAPVVSGSLALGLGVKGKGQGAAVLTALKTSAAPLDGTSGHEHLAGRLGEGRLDLSTYAGALQP